MTNRIGLNLGAPENPPGSVILVEHFAHPDCGCEGKSSLKITAIWYEAWQKPTILPVWSPLRYTHRQECRRAAR